MTKERKAELRKKGAIVAWTCQDKMGFCQLFYLKARGGRFSLMIETEEGDVQTAPEGGGYYILDRKWKIPLLIRALIDQLRAASGDVSRPIYLREIEKVKVLPAVPRKVLKEVIRGQNMHVTHYNDARDH